MTTLAGYTMGCICMAASCILSKIFTNAIAIKKQKGFGWISRCVTLCKLYKEIIKLSLQPPLFIVKQSRTKGHCCKKRSGMTTPHFHRKDRYI